MNFVDVAIPTPLRTTFTYINKTSQTLLGKRVLVEFGRRKVVGVVIDEKADHNSKFKLKEVIEILDDMTPTFNKSEINQITSIAKAYLHPIGDVIDAFLPTLKGLYTENNFTNHVKFACVISFFTSRATELY